MTVLARKIRLIMKLRRSGITDTKVLGAIERVPREVFIPSYFHDQAYEDIALPIGRGQTISQPLVVAAMTQALMVNDRHKVLEIGTGSGYQAAILGKLCRRVYSIERHRPLLAGAEERLNILQIRNITCKAGDGMKGWIEQAPFDRIIVTAAAGDEAPQALLDQMNIGGIMIIPMGRDKASQFIYRVTRDEDGHHFERLMPVRFVPLLPKVARDEPDPVVDDAEINYAPSSGAADPVDMQEEAEPDSQSPFMGLPWQLPA